MMEPSYFFRGQFNIRTGTEKRTFYLNYTLTL